MVVITVVVVVVVRVIEVRFIGSATVSQVAGKIARMKHTILLALAVCMVAASVAAQTPEARPQRPQLTPEQQAEAAKRREAEMTAPRPIDALDSVWMEQLTWMEIRDAIKAGKNTGIILTGGVESNGP